VSSGFWWVYLSVRDRMENRRRWDDNIKMDIQKVGYWGMDRIDLAQDRERWRTLLNALIDIRIS
jgi:hypothetical protein